MDTRYWGPSGWRLLHLIAHAGRGPLAAFFETLPYVLPCKYCRYNLVEHMESDPIPNSKGEFPRWLHRIHNKANAKIRAQGLRGVAVAPDPPFQKVRAVYEDRLAAGCTRTIFDGWEFLFSVAESHPFSRAARGASAIAGAPSPVELEAASPLERNKWNAMEPEERLPYYTRFWELLPQVLPFPEWESRWKAAAAAAGPPECRAACLKWVWAIRSDMEEALELLNRTSFSSLCQDLREARSGCGRGARGKTCRRKRGGSR